MASAAPTPQSCSSVTGKEIQEPGDIFLSKLNSTVFPRPEPCPGPAASIVWLLLLLQLPAAANQSDPAQVVQIFQHELIRAASNTSLQYRQRFDLLQPAIARSHDFDRITRLLGGRWWRSLDQHQRDQFRRTFERLTVALYASRFHDYHGDGFRFVAQSTSPHGVQSTRSALAGSDGQVIIFEYLLQENDTGWHIINTLVDGVSDLALRRSRYKQILDQSGFDALIEKMDQEIATLAATADGE